MRIAAIYIPTGELPHVFGTEHSGVTINLGGRNLYKLKDGEITHIEPNPHFLDDVFNDRVSLLTAIVGGNGGGKTSILRLLTSDSYCLCVMENRNEQQVGEIRYWHRIYYSPYLNNFSFDSMGENGKDLSKLSLLKSDNHGDSGLLNDFLESHNSENMKRWIKFNHFFRQGVQSKVELPTFSKLKMSLGHFDLTTYRPDEFRDTPTQLRNAIRLILKKIEIEKGQEEIAILEGYDGEEARITNIHFPVRFKYDLYEAAIAKFVSILERAGNYYLNEGIIPDDFKEQMANLNVRDAITWFLQNTGVYQGQENYSFAQHIMLIELVDYIVSLIDIERVTDNWREIEISEEEALNIIELYDRFNESFINDWFKFSSKPMFKFHPLISVSSGEQSYLDLFSTLYYHAKNIDAGVDIDGHSSKSLAHIGNDILLLLDEGDNAFHPQWKKEYVKYLRDIIPLIFSKFNVQIIITSHDPLTLSDLPKNNVVFLEKIGGAAVIGSSDCKRTFGANISDLLKDSFFIKNGQIGTFVAGVIDEMITDIRGNNLSPERKIEIERIIKSLDEPVLKFKLLEMLSEVTGDQSFELRMIDEEITRLQKKRRAN